MRSRPRARIGSKPYKSETSRSRYRNSVAEMGGRRTSSKAVRWADCDSASIRRIGCPSAPQQARRCPRRLRVTNAPITVMSAAPAKVRSDSRSGRSQIGAAMNSFAACWIARCWSGDKWGRCGWLVVDGDEDELLIGEPLGAEGESTSGDRVADVAGCSWTRFAAGVKSAIRTGWRFRPQSPGCESKCPAISCPQEAQRLPWSRYAPSAYQSRSITIDLHAGQ